VLSLIILACLAPWLNLARGLLSIELTVYLAALLAGTAITTFPRVSVKIWFGMNLAIITMHLFWGAGFIWSILKNGFKVV
jgi:hypothetical protein